MSAAMAKATATDCNGSVKVETQTSPREASVVVVIYIEEAARLRECLNQALEQHDEDTPGARPGRPALPEAEKGKALARSRSAHALVMSPSCRGVIVDVVMVVAVVWLWS